MEEQMDDAFPIAVVEGAGTSRQPEQDVVQVNPEPVQESKPELKIAVVRLTRLKSPSISTSAETKRRRPKRDQGPASNSVKVEEIILDESSDSNGEGDANASTNSRSGRGKERPALNPRETKAKPKRRTSTRTGSSTATSVEMKGEGLGDGDNPSNAQEFNNEPQPASSPAPMPGTSKSNKSTSDSSTKRKSQSPKKKDVKKKKMFYPFNFYLTADGPPESVKQFFRKTAHIIKLRGGGVCDDVGDHHDSKRKVFLISNKKAETVEYKYCVAYKIPCVRVQWINKCIRENSLVDWKPYELPSGGGVAKNRKK